MVVEEGVAAPHFLIILQVELPVDVRLFPVLVLFHVEVADHLVLPILRVERTRVIA